MVEKNNQWSIRLFGASAIIVGLFFFWCLASWRIVEVFQMFDFFHISTCFFMWGCAPRHLTTQTRSAKARRRSHAGEAATHQWWGFRSHRATPLSLDGFLENPIESNGWRIGVPPKGPEFSDSTSDSKRCHQRARGTDGHNPVPHLAFG